MKDITSFLATRRDVSELIAMGKVKGWKGTDKFGHQASFDTGDFSGGSIPVRSYKAQYSFLSVGTELFLSSSSTDTQEVVIEGLDGDGLAKSLTIAMTGQTPVSIGEWLRVERSYNKGSVDLTGDYYIAESDTVTAGVPQTPSKVKMMVIQAQQQSESAIKTIPANKYGLFWEWWISALKGGAKTVDATLKGRAFGGVFRDMQKVGLNTAGQSVFQRGYKRPKLIAPMTDIIVVVDSVSANGTGISAGFEIDLIEDGDNTIADLMI